MKSLDDKVETKDKVRILLIKNGRPTAGIHVEDDKEFRSPSLEKGSTDASKKR
ncbi:MAG: hypothetical protein VXZ72_00840 [Chlamydiota bacterium]|nr:hypothetical protein [Chlamydiota bacterium]